MRFPGLSLAQMDELTTGGVSQDDCRRMSESSVGSDGLSIGRSILIRLLYYIYGTQQAGSWLSADAARPTR